MTIQLEIPKELEEYYLSGKFAFIFEYLGWQLEQGESHEFEYDVLEKMADAFKESKPIC